MLLFHFCAIPAISSTWFWAVYNRWTGLLDYWTHSMKGVYIQWNGMVEWNSGMDYWNGGMLHRTYQVIQHVLYSEHVQWALRCVLCMHYWLDGWLARLVLHCMNFELWPRPGYTFCHTVCEKGKMTIVMKYETYCGAWLPCNGESWPGSKFKVHTVQASQPSSQQCMQRTQHRAHCTLYNTCWMIRYVL